MSKGRIHLLGTGNAFNHDGRGSQCFRVAPRNGSPFLVDLGPTALAAMMEQRVDPDSHDRLFLTHLHGDHTAGWPFLLLHLAVEARRTRPFEVYGPRGARDCLDGLARLCYGELLEEPTFEIDFHELPVAESAGRPAGEGLGLETFPMDHHPTSIGLRFDLGGLRLAVSGDTRWCEALERLARGSDLLLLECTSIEPTPARHVCLEELRRLRRRLDAERILLVHLDDAVEADLARHPIDGVSSARDGSRFDLNRL